MKKTANTRQTLGVICLLVLCAVLVAALWPFHAPVNEVNWLANENGVRFGRNGTILSRGEFQTKSSSEPSYTLEIYLTPASGRDWHGAVLSSAFGASCFGPFLRWLDCAGFGFRLHQKAAELVPQHQRIHAFQN